MLTQITDDGPHMAVTVEGMAVTVDGIAVVDESATLVEMGAGPSLLVSAGVLVEVGATPAVTVASGDGSGGASSGPGGSTIVLDPSGVEAGNTYTSWATAMAALATLPDGRKDVYIRESLTIPAAAWQGCEATLHGNGAFGTPVVVTVPDGATLSGFARQFLEGGITVDYAGSGAMTTITAAPYQVYMENDAAVRVSGTGDAFLVTATNADLILFTLRFGGGFFDGGGTGHVLNYTGTGSTVVVALPAGNARVYPDTIASTTDRINLAIFATVANAAGYGNVLIDAMDQPDVLHVDGMNEVLGTDARNLGYLADASDWEWLPQTPTPTAVPVRGSEAVTSLAKRQVRRDHDYDLGSFTLANPPFHNVAETFLGPSHIGDPWGPLGIAYHQTVICVGATGSAVGQTIRLVDFELGLQGFFTSAPGGPPDGTLATAAGSNSESPVLYTFTGAEAYTAAGAVTVKDLVVPLEVPLGVYGSSIVVNTFGRAMLINPLDGAYVQADPVSTWIGPGSFTLMVTRFSVISLLGEVGAEAIDDPTAIDPITDWTDTSHPATGGATLWDAYKPYWTPLRFEIT